MIDGLREPSLYAYQTDEPPGDLASLRERYRRLASARSPDGAQHWLNWILVRRDGGGAAGYVQATVANDLASAEIGYVVLGAHQRRGFATEAVGAMVRHLFAAGVQLLRATADARNAASIALLERLEFRREGVRLSDDVIDGVRWVDVDFVRRRRGVRTFPALETPRLRLEPIRARHADALYAGLRDPQLYAYVNDETAPASRQELRERFAACVRRGAWMWALFARAGDEPVGLARASWSHDSQAGDLQIIIVHRFAHRGFAREAVAAVLEFLLRRGIRHASAYVDPRNRAGAAVFEALGFERYAGSLGADEPTDADEDDEDDDLYCLELPEQTRSG